MAQHAKESERLRSESIAGTSNGMTLRTRVVRDRKKYSRKIKHTKRSIADAMDFAFYALLSYGFFRAAAKYVQPSSSMHSSYC